MNKLVKLFVLILIIVLPLALLSCSGQEIVPISAEEKLSQLLENLQTNAQKVSGSLHYNDKESTSFDGIIDKSALKMSVKLNDIDYYYSSKVLLKSSGNGFAVENIDTTLALQKNLIPFNLLYFAYSDKNSDRIYMSESTINITFVGKGAKLSFDSDQDVTGGILSIHFEKDSIKSAVFTAYKNNTKITVYSYYERVTHDFGNPPKVMPTDTASYAQYAVATFAKKYSEHTIHTKAGFDTEAKVSDIIVEPSKIKTVTSVDITDENQYYTLTIIYNTKEMIVGIGSAITTITISYNASYEISLIKINNTEYILKD